MTTNKALTASHQELIQRYNDVIMNTYGVPAITLRQGHGVWLEDFEGKKYLDLLSGVAVNALGQTHPAVVAAITQQANQLGHTSNYYTTQPIIQLAELLIEQLGYPGKVFFCNSGTEANEAAIKLSRKTGRKKIIATQGAFHGRTMGSLSLTGQLEKQQNFHPLIPDIIHVPYGDVTALADVIDDATAAVILEPIMGESGVIVPPVGYLSAARRLTHNTGTLLIFDEVQTGIGRTGWFYAHQAERIVPDAITLAKGLAGGLPMGALIGIGSAGDLLGPGDHGSTFGGNTICAAAAVALITTIKNEGLLDHVRNVGKYLYEGIVTLNSTEITSVRGNGLLCAIELNTPIAKKIVHHGYNHGLLLNATSGNVIRLAPPLIIDYQEIDVFLDRFPAVLTAAVEHDSSTVHSHN